MYLPQEWNGDFASGSGSYTGVTDFQENAWFLQHDLDLEWESACLHGNDEAEEAAQVLTVNIKSIDGKSIEKPSGFTVSFKQLSPPELLRLEAVPNRSASKKDQADSWREPPAHLRLIIASPKDESNAVDAPGQSFLEDDIRELRALQAEVQELQRAIKEKKKFINSQLKKDAESFKEELQQCDSITCVVRAIAHKAHGAWRILYIRFRPNHHHHHHHPPPPPPPMGGPEDPYQRVWRAGNHAQVPEGNVKIDSFHHPPPPPPPPQPTARYGPGHHPPPPPPPHHHHGPPHMPPPDSPYVIALEIVLGLLCCGCLVTILRHRCSSLRTRTERAATREERRTARAYRRAARKLAWRNWWHRNCRDEERIEDYEEKRSLIQHQESVLEEAMQEEIRQLRAAHGVVNDLVRAEEGRIPSCNPPPHTRCYCGHHPPAHNPGSYSPLSTASTYPPTSLPELPSRPLSRTDSLPGYRSDTSSDPPAYEEDEDVSDSVPNGFRHYAPSTTSSTSSRWTPESSVIDVSPRPSAETLRYAEMTDTGVGDAKN